MSSLLWYWLTMRNLGRRSTPGRRKRPSSVLQCECLEARDLPATGFASPTYILLSNSAVSRSANPGPTGGYTPTQITAAYGISQIMFDNGTVHGNGAGTMIAIVDAYNDPNIVGDLAVFDAEYGLPNLAAPGSTGPTLTVESQTGTSKLPAGSKSWSEEIALDVEWSHAVAPEASILLVEATTASMANLLTAVKTAATTPGVVAVSMSWGGSESAGETSDDIDFTTPGVTFLASSGDSGAPTSYPSASPNVVSVGGTTLSLNGSTISSESGWGNSSGSSGGGISAYESQPSYQAGVVTQTSTKRADPDVAYDADPNTGFSEYNSYSFTGNQSPWEEFGGTSDAAPQWAGIIAIADQGRADAGLGSLSGATQTLPMLYSAQSADFHDITTGTSLGTPEYSAGPGYDLVTGRGTPVANLLVPYLVGTGSSSSTVTHFSVSAPSSDIAGTTSFSVIVTALSASNTPVTTYTGTVHFSSSDLKAVLPNPNSFTFVAGDDGSLTIQVSLTLETAGSQTVSVTDTNGITGSSTTVNVMPAAPFSLAFVQQPSNAVAGAVISPFVTVQAADQYGNLETGGTVTLALTGSSATLAGSTATVSDGIATFNSLAVGTAGTYTLTATDGVTATSNSFTISPSGGTGGTGGSGGRVIEGFETPDTWYMAGNSPETAYDSTAAAHDGTYGLLINGNDWLYRTDSAVQVNAGDTLTAWVQFSGAADLANSRAYLGFGTSTSGTLSLVAAPNTDQLLLQSNAGFDTYTTLAATSQTYSANTWYLLEVNWSTSGKIVGELLGSNGTVLSTVSGASTRITTGGIALRAFGDNTYFDTITDYPGVNSFITPATTPSSGTPAAASGSTAAGSLSAGLPSGQSLPPALVAYFAAFPGETSGAAAPGDPASWASWFEIFAGSR